MVEFKFSFDISALCEAMVEPKFFIGISALYEAMVEVRFSFVISVGVKICIKHLAHEKRVIIKNKLDSPLSWFFLLFFFFFSMVELNLKNLPSIKTDFLFLFIIYYYYYYFIYYYFIIIFLTKQMHLPG